MTGPDDDPEPEVQKRDDGVEATAATLHETGEAPATAPNGRHPAIVISPSTGCRGLPSASRRSSTPMAEGFSGNGDARRRRHERLGVDDYDEVPQGAPLGGEASRAAASCRWRPRRIAPTGEVAHAHLAPVTFAAYFAQGNDVPAMVSLGGPVGLAVAALPIAYGRDAAYRARPACRNAGVAPDRDRRRRRRGPTPRHHLGKQQGALPYMELDHSAGTGNRRRPGDQLQPAGEPALQLASPWAPVIFSCSRARSSTAARRPCSVRPRCSSGREVRSRPALEKLVTDGLGRARRDVDLEVRVGGADVVCSAPSSPRTMFAPCASAAALYIAIGRGTPCLPKPQSDESTSLSGVDVLERVRMSAATSRASRPADGGG